MGNMKRRLAVFLSILFILPSILAVLPQASEEVWAGSSVSIGSLGGLSTSVGVPKILSVEAGQQFYIGDYWSILSYTKKGAQNLGTASMVKASYSSSKKSVASVNSKGLVDAKSEGTTDIKMKYKGQTGTFRVEVVKAGSFEKKASYEKVRKAINELIQTMPSKVSSKNAFKLIKNLKAYQEVCQELSSEISTTGFGESMDKLVVPQAGRFNTYKEMLNVYAQKNSPLATRSAKVLKVASIKANRKKIEVKLKKAPTTDQFLSMKISYTIYPYPEANLSAADNKVYFNVTLNDSKKGWKIGLACMTKGSRTITITPQQYKNGKAVNGKLAKGTYRLGNEYDWTKGKKFKVK